MNSMRPGARAMISGERPNVARNFSSSADFMRATDNKKPAGSGGSNKKRESAAAAGRRNSRQGAKLCSGFEAHSLDRPNLHRLLRVRIVAVTSRAHGHRERPETDKRNFLVASQPALQRREHRFRRALGCRLRSAIAQNFLHFV